MNSRNRPQPAGISLTEVLIVLMIIIVLAFILMATVGGSREKARAAVCAQNLRQIGLGLISYVTDNNGRFPNGGADVSWLWDQEEKSWVGTCWYDAAAQNMGRENPSRRFMDPQAEPLPDVFGCPSGHGKAYHPAWPYTGDYAGNWHLGNPKSTVKTMAAVRNPSSTPYVQDTVKQNNFGEGIFNKGASKTANNAFSDRHGGKGNILWVDGHVTSMGYSEYMNFANDPRRGGRTNFIKGNW